MLHGVQLVELHGTRRRDKTLQGCHDPSWTVVQRVPATEFISEPIRDNDAREQKKKMAAIGSGARVAAFDWNIWDRKRKLLVFFLMMMMIDDEAVLVLPLSSITGVVSVRILGCAPE